MNYYLGIDFGTSGARAVVIDENRIVKAEIEQKFAVVPPQFWAGMWKKTLFNLITQLPYELRTRIKAIAINGTSSTVMLCDERGNVLDTPLLYNDGRGVGVLERLKAIAPANNIVLSATSSLAKLLWISEQPFFNQGRYLLHQADYLAYLLHGKLGISDYHNALKLGYDVEKLAYPTWLTDLPIMPLLPQVLAPGTLIGEVTAALGLRSDCVVCAGTTDSIAAFLASGASKPGEAVTSLGSTLVLKLLSRTREDNAEFGTSSVTPYVESISGVLEGGRTGFTAVIIGLLFILSLFFIPIFSRVTRRINRRKTTNASYKAAIIWIIANSAYWFYKSKLASRRSHFTQKFWTWGNYAYFRFWKQNITGDRISQPQSKENNRSKNCSIRKSNLVTRFSPFVAQTPVICDRRLQLQDYLKFLLLG
jgi:hypothetical protein